MKHASQPLLTLAGILLLAFLSVLLLPAPALGLQLAQSLVQRFHLLDMTQLYIILYCLWFMLLGTVEFFVLRFIWKRWFAV